MRYLLKQADPEATNQEIDTLFKAVTEILRGLEMAEDPQENLINALRKIEGKFDYLVEMREHLNKHFDAYDLNKLPGNYDSIYAFEKQVQARVKNENNERKREEAIK